MFVALWVCYHGNSKLRASIFTKLVYSIGKGSDHAKPLAMIFKQLLSVAYIPEEWKKATITSVHKNGSTNLCSNYRPFSITCVCCKILERILVKRIQEHLAANNILHPAQH